MSDRQFHGEGYDTRALSPVERARHRHLYAEVDKNFRPISEDQLKILADATIVTQAARLIQNLPKTIMSLCFIVGGAIGAGAWLASKGIL